MLEPSITNPITIPSECPGISLKKHNRSPPSLIRMTCKRLKSELLGTRSMLLKDLARHSNSTGMVRHRQSSFCRACTDRTDTLSRRERNCSLPSLIRMTCKRLNLELLGMRYSSR